MQVASDHCMTTGRMMMTEPLDLNDLFVHDVDDIEHMGVESLDIAVGELFMMAETVDDIVDPEPNKLVMYMNMTMHNGDVIPIMMQVREVHALAVAADEFRQEWEKTILNKAPPEIQDVVDKVRELLDRLNDMRPEEDD